MNPSLAEYLHHNVPHDARHQAVAAAVMAFASASMTISELIGRGALAGITGESVGGTNADGDVQKDLDLRAEEIIRTALSAVDIFRVGVGRNGDARIWRSVRSDRGRLRPPGWIVQYRNQHGGRNHLFRPAQPRRPATVHGSWKRTTRCGIYHLRSPDFSCPDRSGMASMYLRSIASSAFTGWSRKRVQIPAECSEYAINASNHRHWERPVRVFVEQCLAGADGPRQTNFNMRWIASLVAETYRILIRGGVFLYPSDARPGYADGRPPAIV